MIRCVLTAFPHNWRRQWINGCGKYVYHPVFTDGKRWWTYYDQKVVGKEIIRHRRTRHYINHPYEWWLKAMKDSPARAIWGGALQAALRIKSRRG